MDLGLEGRNVLVTGGSRGIGRAIAEAFLREGARVVICARNPEGIQAAVAQLQPLGEIWGVRADVSDESSVQSLVQQVRDRWGHLDVLVNNAGRIRPGRVTEFPDEVWQQELNGKLLGTIRVTRHALPLLRRDGNAAIVNMAGMTGKQLFPNGGLTGVINAGVIAFTKYLAREVAPLGIRANAVCPGVVRTEGWEERGAAIARERGIPVEQFFEEFVQAQDIFLGRWAHPAEIADVVVLLASPRLSYLTGQTVIVDGGLAKFVA